MTSRRPLSLLVAAAAAAILLAGCGTATSPGAPNSIISELAYFQPGSPLVMTIATDPSSSPVHGLLALINRFAPAASIKAALGSEMTRAGISYAKDIRPLLGNPLALGISGSTTSAAGVKTHVLIAWVTKSAGALRGLLGEMHLPKAHSYDGAAVYSAGTTSVAVSGATLLLAESPQQVMAALDTRKRGEGIAASDYNAAVSGLPSGSLVQGFGNLQGVLSGPSVATARRVPWVAALRGYAFSLAIGLTGLDVRFKLDTTGAPLSVAQLPVAAGSTPPQLAGAMPIVLGLKDPAQLVSFIEGAAQTAEPAKYAKFLARQAVLRRRTGTDVNALLSLLTGDLIVDTDTHITMARAALSDPTQAAHVLARLVRSPLSLLSGPGRIRSAGGGFYLNASGNGTLAYGVVGDELVAGNASPAELRAFAQAPTYAPPAGARGALAFRISLPALLHAALHGGSSASLTGFLGSLGDVTGWAQATPSSLTGDAALALK